MSGQKYEDSKGRTITIKSVENNIAILNNGDRVAVERLNDRNFYTPLGDQESSINESGVINDNTNHNIMDNASSRYEQLINNFQGGKSSVGIDEQSDVVHNRNQSMQGNDPSVSISGVNSVVERHNSNRERNTPDDRGESVPVVQPYKQQEQPKREEEEYPETRNEPLDPEQELLKKYNVNTPPKSSESLNKIVYGEADKEDDNIDTNAKTIVDDIQPKRRNVEELIEVVKENPVYQMFDKAKRTHSLNVNLKINEKIPDKDIIKMMEDNFDESAIDYFTNQIFKKLMADPKIIEEQVKEAINKYVVVKKTKPRAKAKPKPKPKN